MNSNQNQEYIKKFVPAGQLKKGDIVILKEHVCKIISISISKTGKHGHSKVHLIFENVETKEITEDIMLTSSNIEWNNGILK